MALPSCWTVRPRVYATAKLDQLHAVLHPPSQMAAASIYFSFGVPVPKVGVVGGRRTIVHANIQGGATRAARAQHGFVSEN